MSKFAWRPKYSPALIISQISSRRKISGSKVTLEGAFGDTWDQVLASSIRVPAQVDGTMLASAVRKAIFDASCDFASPEGVINCVERHADLDFRRPTESFKLVVEITAPPVFEGKRSLNGTRVLFGPRRDSRWFRKAAQSRLRIVDENKTYPIAEAGRHLPVVVTVRERDRFRAGQGALREFEVIRSAMNLILNRGKTWRWSFGYPPKPVNEILLGPLHTVHQPDGSAISESNFWFESDFVAQTAPANLADKARFETTTETLLSMLHENKLKGFAEEGLRRYVNALDKRRWHDAIVELWAALEHLTASREQNYDVLVARAANLFSNHDKARQILLHIRQHRNALVHESRSVDHTLAEGLMYGAKQFVEELLWIVTRNRLGFATPEEFGQFLETTPNRKAFQRQRHVLKAVSTYRSW